MESQLTPTAPIIRNIKAILTPFADTTEGPIFDTQSAPRCAFCPNKSVFVYKVGNTFTTNTTLMYFSYSICKTCISDEYLLIQLKEISQKK